MVAKIIDGKAVAQHVRQECKRETLALKAQGVTPGLAVIIVGDNPASKVYVANKVRACTEVGLDSTVYAFAADTPDQVVLDKILALNADPLVHGILVQLPLPKHFDVKRVLAAISVDKDVDGFHPVNVGRLSIGLPCYVCATPSGIIELIKRYEIPTAGKNCVVIGRSNIVGKPVASLMMQKGYPGDATVTVCHSRTKNLKEICLQADIIIAALGMPEFLTADMVKEGAAIIDVGTTRVPSTQTKSGFRLSGDVKFDEVAPKCSYITPVPGGVGPMTIVSLLKNTLLAAKGEIY